MSAAGHPRAGLGLGLGLALLGGAALGLVAAPGRAAAAPPASQPLVVMLRDHVARAKPTPRGHRITTVRARRPLTRVRTALPILDEATRSGQRWLRVILPGRPNGRTGWIPAARTMPAVTTWRLVVDLSSRRVTVYHDGRVARRFRAVVGAGGTPTPRGRFFIEEVVTVASGHPGGPFALATSARSNVFQEFEGGDGQVAIHGTNGLAAAVGTAASHGCVRISPSAITWLARRIDSGAPLSITR